MAWQGQNLNWSKSYDLLMETHNILWTPHPNGNSYKTVGKGINKRKVLMTDNEQKFSDLKQMFNRICKEPSVKPRVYKEGSYDKKETKRKGDSEAVKNGTAEASQQKRQKVVQDCTRRNHEASFLVGVIQNVTRSTCQRSILRVSHQSAEADEWTSDWVDRIPSL